MTLKDLQARAKELGIKGFSKMKKDELAAALEAVSVSPVDQDETPVIQLAPTIPSTVELAPFTTILAGRNTGNDARKAKNAAKRRRQRLRSQGYNVGFGT